MHLDLSVTVITKIKLGVALLSKHSFPDLFDKQSSVQFFRIIEQDTTGIKV